MAAKIVTHEIAVVGLKFRMDKNVRETLARMCQLRPQKLKLVRQQENEYDINAIAVLMDEGSFKGKQMRKGDIPGQIGYVGAETAAVIAPRMDDGILIVDKAELLSLVPPDHLRGEMMVTMRDVS